jgi:hypothetical protein
MGGACNMRGYTKIRVKLQLEIPEGTPPLERELYLEIRCDGVKSIYLTQDRPSSNFFRIQ